MLVELDDVRNAYEAHYASTPGACENCTACGENFRHPVHLRIGETKDGRIQALHARVVTPAE